MTKGGFCSDNRHPYPPIATPLELLERTDFNGFWVLDPVCRALEVLPREDSFQLYYGGMILCTPPGHHAMHVQKNHKESQGVAPPPNPSHHA